MVGCAVGGGLDSVGVSSQDNESTSIDVLSLDGGRPSMPAVSDAVLSPEPRVDRTRAAATAG